MANLLAALGFAQLLSADPFTYARYQDATVSLSNQTRTRFAPFAKLGKGNREECNCLPWHLNVIDAGMTNWCYHFDNFTLLLVSYSNVTASGRAC